MNTFHLLALLFLIACVWSCAIREQSNPFITVEQGQFIKDGRPYYYIGTNFWYGAILASQGQGGNRDRLIAELDSMSSVGIDNLRILVGADGANGVVSRVEPTLQMMPGVYNDTILDGLDYLLCEMEKRGMKAVLYLNNSWEWSGGYGQYLEWAGHGKAPIPAIDGWDKFNAYVSQYLKSDSCKTLFANHVKYILSRTNRYTGIKYTDDPTIMSWQIGNEPRAFGEENKTHLVMWLHSVADLIKSLDSNHLVSTGNEGAQGCEGDINLWESIHAYANIDYMTIHIWPYNWGWAKQEMLDETLPYSIKETGMYIADHQAIARKYDKPLVIEEFGYPRDGFQFAKQTSTKARNAYYASVFDAVLVSREANGVLAGCNFWAWGGMANQKEEHVFWQRGDDYMGDPAQEQQGLYSVFQSDDTVDLVRDYNRKIGK